MLNSFTIVASTLRFVVATTAFGMGLTDPDKRSYSLGYAFMTEEYVFKRLHGLVLGKDNCHEQCLQENLLRKCFKR